MTNKKAIELLRKISDSQLDGKWGDERREALEMAVRALFSQQIVNDSQGLVNDCISRKQAIDAFEPEHDTDWYTPQIIEVLEALPPVQPTQTNADSTHENTLDCVSRQAAIDGIKKEILKGDRRFYKGLLVANHVILHLPPAHPQRKTGKWKLVNYSDGCIDEVECDQCGDLEIYKSNYCPNCGARMDGESE